MAGCTRFRHFFVSQCFLGGASEGEIREWVGHADSKMVEHYRHLGRKDALAKMEQINFVAPDANEQARTGQEKQILLRYFDPGVCNGPGNTVRTMIKASWTKADGRGGARHPPWWRSPWAAKPAGFVPVFVPVTGTNVKRLS